MPQVLELESKVEVLDGYILARLTVGASDHAPLGMTLALRRGKARR